MKPRGTAEGLSAPPARTENTSRGAGSNGLLEQVVAKENMKAALRRVEHNGGAPGVDGMTTESLRDHLKHHWLSVREALLTGDYKPMPVRRFEIPKPDGGVRLLGIPTVLDRLIQQALLQVLT
ncbi:MAG: group II intron reverse transcriptase/maturase, partial [Chloroflexota bacterium]